MDSTSMKTIAVLAIMFGCFVVLWPKIFQPMVFYMLGLGEKRLDNDDTIFSHPRERRGAPVYDSRPGKGDPKRGHSNPRPLHPGMRHAAEMRKESTGQGGGGRGMMGMILPMYAIGIVVYLIYTLSKVFTKQDEFPTEENYKAKKLADRKKHLESHDKTKRDDFNRAKQKAEVPQPTDEIIDGREKLIELEKLLSKAGGDNLNAKELNNLQLRLAETEKQMARILEAMQSVKLKMAENVEDEVQSTEKKEENEEEKLTEEKSQSVENTPQKTNDSEHIENVEDAIESDNDADDDSENQDTSNSSEDDADLELKRFHRTANTNPFTGNYTDNLTESIGLDAEDVAVLYRLKDKFEGMVEGYEAENGVPDSLDNEIVIENLGADGLRQRSGLTTGD